MSSNISITLEKPPSLNAIYGYTSRGGFARSYITPKGKKWFRDSSEKLSFFSGKETIRNPVEVHIKLRTCRHQDVDNVIKPILDLFSSSCLLCFEKYSSRKKCICGQQKGILENDVLVMKLIAEKEKVHKMKDENVEISVRLL